MTYSFHASSDLEVKRYLVVCEYALDGVYGKSFFYVLNNLPEKNKNKCIYIPKLEALSIDQLKNLVKINNIFMDQMINQKLVGNSKLINQMKNDFNPPSLEEVRIFEKEWKKKKDEFKKTLPIFFEKKLLSKVKHVDVVLTRLGSIGSFSRLFSDGRFEICVRIDSEISIMAELILTSLLNCSDFENKPFLSKDDMKTFDWIVRESTVDFLLKTPQLKQLFPNYHPTMESVVDSSSELYEKSCQYLLELGVPIKTSLFVDKDNGLILNAVNNKQLKNLTPSETKLLKLLLKNNGQAVSYETIAQHIWGDDYLEKFSLNAINKLVYELRVKLRINKVLGATIHSSRGFGYRLEA